MLSGHLRLAYYRLPRRGAVRRSCPLLQRLDETVDVCVEAIGTARLAKQLIDAAEKIVANGNVAERRCLNTQLGLNERIDCTGESDPAHAKAKVAREDIFLGEPLGAISRRIRIRDIARNNREARLGKREPRRGYIEYTQIGRA